MKNTYNYVNADHNKNAPASASPTKVGTAFLSEVGATATFGTKDREKN
jgi:hypothetical protein